MNIIQKAKENEGYFRIFHDQWNEETKEAIKKASVSGEIEYIELPFSWGNLRYVFIRDHECSEVVTVMFKIPMNLIPYEELWSKWGKRRRQQLTEFLQAWLLRARLDEAYIRKLHAHHTYCYATVSVPKFLKHRLFSHLRAFKMVFKEVSPEYIHIECQGCGTNFRFRTMTSSKSSECPHCGASSFVR